ncbi:uncharacterized protein [Montipora foliosa]|uniref:uncharacterized protein n=1 Tax=Montipora foliosa TaxID=591990 RepID=UPI0035F12A21
MGIVLDSVHMEARLHDNKLTLIRDLLASFKKHCSARLVELQSLVGTLQFACKVVVPGRTFLQRIINLTKGVPSCFHHIPLNREFFKDINMWKVFHTDWNGRSFFLDSSSTPTPDLELYADAASSVGFGGFLQGHWLQGRWPPHLHLDRVRGISIEWQELFPIVVACAIWHPFFTGKRLQFWCDNESMVSKINSDAAFSGSSPCRRPDALYHSAFANDPLKAEVLTYASWGLAKNTNHAYSTGEKRFLTFCLMNRLQSPSGEVLPASEGTLIYFASYLARSVRHCTIKLYLAAVRKLHITAGFPGPIKGKLLLRKVLKGILRFQGDVQIRHQPVTPQVLCAIRPILQSWLSPRDFSMIWAAFTLAFFAFLLCSEFTYPGISQFRSSTDRSTNCIGFHPNLACPQYMTVHIKSSKTHAFQHGHYLTLARTFSPICAVMAVRRYFLLTTPPHGPVLRFQTGRYLTRPIVAQLLRDRAMVVGLTHHSLKGQSFRSGAASTAAAACVPDWLIKMRHLIEGGAHSSKCGKLKLNRTEKQKILKRQKYSEQKIAISRKKKKCYAELEPVKKKLRLDILNRYYNNEKQDILRGRAEKYKFMSASTKDSLLAKGRQAYQQMGSTKKEKMLARKRTERSNARQLNAIIHNGLNSCIASFKKKSERRS